MPIADFKHKGLKELFITGYSAKIRPDMKKNLLLILDTLAEITKPEDLKGFKDYHPLVGNRRGSYSMHVNKNFCITFRWNGENATDVHLEDYH